MGGERKGKSSLGICVVLSIGSLLLIVQAGCSDHSAGYIISSNSDDMIMTKSADWPYSIEVIERPDGTKDYFWEIDSSIEQSDTSALKYHQAYNQYRFAVVEGSIGPGGRKYPVVVDTGASQPLFVKKVHIQQNNLKVKSLNTKGSNGRKTGLCYLPELDIATIRLIDWPCLSLKSQSLGFGVRDDFVVMGLPILREFKYIVFDDILGQIEFSKDKVFEPGETDSWAQFPIWLEEDFSGNVFLFARMVVGNQEMDLQLDTGSGRGLAISEELWEQMPPDTKQVRLKPTKELYPYIGNLSCKRGVVAELGLGNRQIYDVPVSVYADDSPLVEDCGGLMGMQLFRETVMVIDFENELMWVKRS